MMEMLKCWDFRPDWRMGVSLSEWVEGVALKRQIYYKTQKDSHSAAAITCALCLNDW